MDIRLSSPALDFHVDVRLTSRAGRWVAVAEIAGEREIGLGRTAHEALAASLWPLGRDAAAVLLADPGLMAASAEMP
jgi:hypothetical protein